MTNKLNKVLFVGITGSCILLLSPSALADCSPTASGLISCDNTTTAGQSFNQPQGLNVQVEKNASVDVSAPNTPAIDFIVRSGALTNNGTINTTATQSDSIRARGADFQTIINNSAITTSGDASDAIKLSELWNSTVTNNGQLVTSGNDSHGINVLAGSRGHTVTNAGTITVSGENSSGINATNSFNNRLINQSQITSFGTNGNGIRVANNTTAYTITNTSAGVIYAQNGYGVRLSDNSLGNNISNNGIIGGGIAGVALTDDAQAESIINTGYIIGGGSGAGVLFTDNSNSNLFLNQGIIGALDGDAIRAENDINITNGINNEGIIVGRVNAPGSNMSNSGIFELLRESSPSVVNNYNQSDSGVLGLQADSTSSYGQLQVAGNASLNGRTVVVTDGSTKFNSGDLLVDVVRAGSITGTPSAVLDDSLRYQFVQEQTASSYSLRVVDTNLTTVQDAITTASNNNSLASVGTVIDTIIQTDNTPTGGNPVNSQVANCAGALASAVCAITSSSNADQVHKTVVQLTPLMDGSMPYIEMNNLRAFGDIVGNRQESVRSQEYTSEFNPEKYLWIRPVGRWDNQSASGDFTGYNADTRGIAIGADGLVLDQARLGLALGMSRTDVNDTSSDIRHDAQIESWNLLAYGGYDFTPDTGMTWQTGFGKNTTKGNRYLNTENPTDGTTIYAGVARSDYDSHTVQAGLGLQSNFHPSSDVMLTPELRTDYYRVKDKGYQEDGADDLGLNVNGMTTEALIISSKVKAGVKLSDIVNVQGYIGAGYDTMNDQTETKAAFIGSEGTPFTYTGMSESPWIAMAGVGVTANFNDVLDGTVQYDAAQRTRFTSQSVSLKVRYAF
ncbi:autotransporter domain-containing protein [Salmonella enterica subsp. enterica serovar Bonariensis]|nr:autotransporter domain-containing protein [Salmonella enterica subsp. enterica serovar Bonariensis]